MSPFMPASTKAAYITAIVVATLLGCCASLSGASVVAQFVMQRQLDLGAGMDGDPSLGQLMAMQRTFAVITFVLVVLQLMTSGALAVGGSLGLSGRRLGWTLTLLAFGAFLVATLLEVGGGIWSWSQTQDMLGAMGGAPMGGQELGAMRIAGALGLLPSACWASLKLGVAIAASAALLSPESRAYHAQLGEVGAPLGPRG